MSYRNKPISELIELLKPGDLASMIDHTLLKPHADYKLLEKYVEDTRKYGFAVLMVPPSLLIKAREIAGRTIKLATVIGFPLGNTLAGVKVIETRLASQAGASEVDMVMNNNFFKSGEYDRALDDMIHVVREARKQGISAVKVIIETGLLTDEEKVKAVELVVESGADYVKTSTGFVAGGATIHDVSLLYKAAGGRVKVKAAGGIRHAVDALAMISVGAERIGTSTGDRIMEEFIRLREGRA